MKKVLFGLLMVFALLAVIASVSATLPLQKVLVAGKIYNADYTATVANASVQVVCTYNDTITNTDYSINTTSISDGSYSVVFNDDPSTFCSLGSALLVHAHKAGVGENTVTGEVNINMAPVVDLSLGVVNVPLIPEFGFFAASLTVIGAVGMFFLIRRK